MDTATAGPPDGHSSMHRHGTRTHAHPHSGPHRHLTALRLSEPATVDRHAQSPGHSDSDGHGRGDRSVGLDPRHDHDHDQHGHSHGLVDDSIKRSRAGIVAVSQSLAVLALTAGAQVAIFLASGSIALLADLIHNGGDALTAVPLGIAFALRSKRAEQRAGLFVVATIFVSACVAGGEAIARLIDPVAPSHLAVLALAGATGFAGNFAAARIRLRAGRRLQSAALIADGNHAHADAYVSLAVVGSAIVVALGAPVADPLIGLLITAVILRITWQSWGTVSGREHSH